jgi:hypothetical protein
VFTKPFPSTNDGGDSYTDTYEKQAYNTGTVAGGVFSDFREDSSCLQANDGILTQLEK